MDFMTKNVEEYERERQEIDKIIDTMKRDMVNMNEKIEKLERIVDRKEQYPRCICLLMHGMQGERENTEDLVLETLNEKMCIDLTPSDLDRTHRIGQKKALSKNQSQSLLNLLAIIQEKKMFQIKNY